MKIVHKNAVELTEADVARMRTTVRSIKRHLARRRARDVADERSAHVLKNWGHDPSKDA